MVSFHTTILQARVSATGLEVPPAVLDDLGGGRRPAVVVTLANPAIGSYSYRSTVGAMGGRSLVPLSSEHRTASGLAAGDEVDVSLELDTAPREIAVPSDLAEALDADPSVRSSFDALSYSRQRAIVDPITQAKAEETRARRIEKAVEGLRA